MAPRCFPPMLFSRLRTAPFAGHAVRACAVLALLAAGPAWSVDRAASLPLPPAVVVPVQAGDSCRALLDPSLAVAGPALREREIAVPAAILGLIVGVRYATGPREALMRADAGLAAPEKAQAVAAYRRCRAEALLTELSN